MVPGSDILVKVSDESHSNGGYQCRGVVIWCIEIADKNAYKYAVGVEFYEPNIVYHQKMKISRNRA